MFKQFHNKENATIRTDKVVWINLFVDVTLSPWLHGRHLLLFRGGRSFRGGIMLDEVKWRHSYSIILISLFLSFTLQILDKTFSAHALRIAAPGTNHIGSWLHVCASHGIPSTVEWIYNREKCLMGRVRVVCPIRAPEMKTTRSPSIGSQR